MVFSRHLPRRADKKVIFLHQIHFLDSVWYYITLEYMCRVLRLPGMLQINLLISSQLNRKS